MSFKDCLDKGLIKKHKTKDRVPRSLDIADKFLQSARNNLDIDEFEMSIIAAYNSIFHSIRALLFDRNYTEKSHYCLFEAVKELNKEDDKLLNFLNAVNKVRLSRHNIQYRGNLQMKKNLSML